MWQKTFLCFKSFLSFFFALAFFLFIHKPYKVEAMVFSILFVYVKYIIYNKYLIYLHFN